MIKSIFLIALFFVLFSGCESQTAPPKVIQKTSLKTQITTFDTVVKTVHVFVALCDNKYQGIVPVPAKIGNGQDTDNNLYWGCGFGIRSYFKASKEWKFLKAQKLDSIKMERLIFKHATKNFYLVADAYNGKHIQECTVDFLCSAAGQIKDTVQVNQKAIGIAGNASLVAYIGHDGLMDFQLTANFTNADGKTRDCIILACASKNYFAPHLKATKANPLVWTTNLMCPEAYTLHDALTGFVSGETSEQVRARAATAYAKYQRCSLKGAKGLLVTGW